MCNEFNEERYVMDVPTYCPNCGHGLEVDTGYEKTMLICPKCDYSLDATEEFEKAREAEFGGDILDDQDVSSIEDGYHWHEYEE